MSKSRDSKSVHEYLKVSKSSAPTDIPKGSRAYRRREQREFIKNANWRKLRKTIGATLRISFAKRVALIKHVMA